MLGGGTQRAAEALSRDFAALLPRPWVRRGGGSRSWAASGRPGQGLAAALSALVLPQGREHSTGTPVALRALQGWERRGIGGLVPDPESLR